MTKIINEEIENELNILRKFENEKFKNEMGIVEEINIVPDEELIKE